MPLRGVREVKTHAAARRVWGVKSHAAARRVESEDTPLRGVSAVKIRRCAACGK